MKEWPGYIIIAALHLLEVNKSLMLRFYDALSHFNDALSNYYDALSHFNDALSNYNDALLHFNDSVRLN